MGSARLVTAIVAARTVAACYDPSAGQGAPCVVAAGNCPEGQRCLAQGAGYVCMADDGTLPDGGLPATPDGPSAPVAHIAYVAPFVQRYPGTGSTDSFTARARAAGNAVVIQVSCAATAIPTAVSVTAPGWTFTQLGPITASTVSPQRSATVFAIAPDALQTTVTVQWTGSTCSDSKNHLGDEFAVTPATAGPIAVDHFGYTEGTGNCTGSIVAGPRVGVVWGACNSDDEVSAVGPQLEKGADDGAGDWSGYRLMSHASSTSEPVQFINANVGYVLSMVTLRPPG